MMLTRRSLTLGALAGTATVTLAPGSLTAAARASGDGCGSESGQVVLDWERISFRTVYTTALTPIPVGVPVLGFTSVALHRAARRAARHRSASGAAAVASAAHDVLVHYYPTQAAALAADLATSLAAVTSSESRDRGARIGAGAAADLLADRVGDNYLETKFHYSKAEGPGVWQPNPGAIDMLAPWLGSLRFLFLHRAVRVDGPWPLSSGAYASEYDEVRRLGSAASTERTQTQTDTAQFFNSNSATMVGDALIRYLEGHPIGLESTARLFAMIHGAMTDSAIQVWRLKRDVGFWRPSQAIAGAGADGNPATATEAGWLPLVPNPNYSDYVSGHAGLTGPACEIIRRTLGDGTPLELRSVNSPTPRTYPSLTALEQDAFHARIWSGLHFRKAMVDGYAIAHRTASRVLEEFDD